MHKHLSPPRFARHSILLLLILSSLLPFIFQQDSTKTETRRPQKGYLHAFDNLPMRFEENLGQVGFETKFFFRDRQFSLRLRPDQTVISLRAPEKKETGDQSIQAEITMRIVGANPDAEARGLDELITKSNYFIGNNPENWRTAIPNYGKVKFKEVYPGIDLVYYGKDGQLEYDFQVAPGASPEAIALQFDKATEPEIDDSGNLVLQAGSDEMTMQAPVAYQEIAGEHELVAAHFASLGGGRFGFEVGEYDPSVPLVIDPVLTYSTFLGVSDYGNDIAVDATGHIYITGNIGGDAFVGKLNPDGSELIYATRLGGDLDESGLGIAVDTAGYVYVTGETQSDDFPTHNAVQEDFGGMLWVDGDAFITKLNPDGSSFVYSTYLGGGSEDIGRDIAVDLSGNAYVTGVTNSSDFPVANAIQPAINDHQDNAFVTKLNADGSAFVFSTLLGGSGDDEGNGIAIDSERNIYITGATSSNDFPTVHAFQEAGGSWNAFVTKINAQGTALVFSTYLTGGNGGNYPYSENGTGITVNAFGQVYVVGKTTSPDFPTTNALQPSYASEWQGDGFVTKFTADGSGLLFSTFLGGREIEDDLRITLDFDGNAFIVGRTTSTDFLTEQPVQAALNGPQDAFVTGISADGLDLLFSSYLGGSGYDEAHGIATAPNGSLYLTGWSNSNDFPLVSPLQTSSSGGAFVSIIDLGQSKEMHVVKVMQDPLNHTPVPIANTTFEIYYIDLSKLGDPLNFVEFQTSDADGLLKLDTDYFHPGDAFFVRARPFKENAAKAGHEEVDGIMYEVFVDNMSFDLAGLPEAAHLSQTQGDTTVTYLQHTSIGFNLVVSIEWHADQGYVENLKTALRNGNNYFYDVSNGQAFLRSVAIYDDKVNWENADIQIFAKNTQWPQADLAGIRNDIEHLRLPPIHLGSASENIDATFSQQPLELHRYDHFSTIIHELGHYLFGFYDEYEDKDGNLVYPDKTLILEQDIDFGYMDNQYKREQAMASEMSAFESNEYKRTRQFQIIGQTCWEFFRSQFSDTYGEVRAEIHTPKRMGQQSPFLVAGPNDNLEFPDYSTGDMMRIIDHTKGGTVLEVVLLAKDESTGQILPDVEIAVEKKAGNRWIPQGNTVLRGPDEGKIRLRGAEVGDKVYLSSDAADGDFRFLTTVVPSSSQPGLFAANAAEPVTLFLKSVSGSISLLSAVEFNGAGNLNYLVAANKPLNGLPAVRVLQDNSIVEEIPLTSTGAEYYASLPEPDKATATLLLMAQDSLDQEFIVPGQLSVFDLSAATDQLVHSGGNVEIFVDTTTGTPERVAVLSSAFPAPAQGLADSLRRVSPVVAISVYPAAAVLDAFLKIYYNADSLQAANPEAIAIYHWDNGWQPLETALDRTFSTAGANIDAPGFYAAFLDLKQSVIVTGVRGSDQQAIPEGFQLQQNYPNPFNPSTVIRFALNSTEMIQLVIYNLRGQKVRELASGRFPGGQYEAIWDGHDDAGRAVASGVYLYRLHAGREVQSRKMLLLH